MSGKGVMARALAAAAGRKKVDPRGGPEGAGGDVPRFPLIAPGQQWPAVTLGGPGNTGAGTGLALLPPAPLVGEAGATDPASPAAASAASPAPLVGETGATGLAPLVGETGATGLAPLVEEADATGPKALAGEAGATGPEAPAVNVGATGPEAQPQPQAPPAAQPLAMGSEEPTRFVRFGQELFVLDSSIPTAHLGAPNVLTKQDFDQRVSTDPTLQDVVSKYWRVENVLAMPISEKQPNQFRVPCDEGDKTKMKQAFALYLTSTQDRVASYGNTDSDEKRFYQMHGEHIQAYINELNATSPHLPCITKEEITRPIKVPSGAAAAAAGPIDAYYTLLPKIFFLLYQNQKAQNPLDVGKIFASYPALNQTVRSYLDSLEVAGPFESERGIYDMANAIIELFFLLRKLFPNLYGNLIPTPEVYQRWAVLGFPLPGGPSGPTGQAAPAAPGAAPGEQPAADEGGPEVTEEEINAMLDPILNRLIGLSDDLKNTIKAGVQATFVESRAKREPAMLTGLQGVLTTLTDFVTAKLQAHEALLESTKNLLTAYSTVNTLRIAALSANPIGSLQFGDGEVNHEARVGLDAALEALRTSFPENDQRRLAIAQFITGQQRLDAAIQALQGRALQEAAAAAAAGVPAAPGAPGAGEAGEGEGGEAGPGAVGPAPGAGDLAALTAERDALRAELAAARAALDPLQREIEGLRETLAALQGQGAGAAGQAAQVQADLAARAAELAAAQAAAAALEARVGELNEQLEALRTAGAASAARAAELQEQLDAATAALEPLQAQVAGLEQQLRDLIGAGGGSAAEIAGLRAQLQEAQAAQAAAAQQAAALQGQLDAATGALDGLRTTSEATQAELRGLLAAAQAAVARITDEKNAAEARAAAAEARVGELTAEIADLQRQLEEARRTGGDSAALRAQIAQLEATLAAAREEVREATERLTGERDAAAARAAAAEAQVAQLTEQIAQLERDLEEARRTGGDVAALQAQIQQLTRQLQAAQAEAETLRGQLRQAQTDAAAAAQKAAEDLEAEKAAAEAALAKCAADAAAEKAALEAQTAAEMAALRDQIAAGDAGRADALAAAQRQAADAAAAAEDARRAAQQAIAAAQAETQEARGQRDQEAAAKAAAQRQRDQEAAAKAAAEAAAAREVENRKALYRNISASIQGLMQRVGAKTGELTKMPGQSGQLQAKLLAPLTAEYSDAIPVAQVGSQQNMVTFSAAMSELESYLGALDGQYNSWKSIFEGGRPAPIRAPESPGFLVAKDPTAPYMRIRIEVPPTFDREYDVNEIKTNDPTYRRASLQELAQALQSEINNPASTQLKDALLRGVDRPTLESFLTMLNTAGATVRRGKFGTKIPDLPGGPGANAYGTRQPGGIVQPPPQPAIVQAPPAAPKAPAYDPTEDIRRQQAEEAERRRRAAAQAAEDEYRRQQAAAAAEADRRRRAAEQAAADEYRRQQEAAAAQAAARRGPTSVASTGTRVSTTSGSCAQYKHDAKKCNADPRCVYHNYNCHSKRSLGMAGGGIIAPGELPGILKQQDAWNHLNDAFNSIPPEIQSRLPAPPAAPIYEVAEPFNVYINKESDPILLEEAREALGLLPQKDIDTYMEEPHAITPALMDVILKYKAALPSVAPEWLTSMVQADILKQMDE